MLTDSQRGQKPNVMFAKGLVCLCQCSEFRFTLKHNRQIEQLTGRSGGRKPRPIGLTVLAVQTVHVAMASNITTEFEGRLMYSSASQRLPRL